MARSRLALAEKHQVSCAEIFVRWEGLVAKAAMFPEADRRWAFLETARDMGLVEKIALLKEACADPARAPEILGEPIEALLDRTWTSLFLLEEGVDTSERLDVDIRAATVAAGQVAQDAVSAAEQARVRTVATQALIPAVIGVMGGLLTTALSALLFK